LGGFFEGQGQLFGLFDLGGQLLFGGHGVYPYFLAVC
jgi:hypothetical protein